jgi:predicted DNA-binding protein (UPF0251 family)
MSRPRKFRRICRLPKLSELSPSGGCGENRRVNLTLDEYEAVRLIDLEGLTQEKCAEQMNVARQTVTLIYESARRKIADCIVNCKGLMIAGGDYVLCEHSGCCRGNCVCGKKTDNNNDIN